jgi:hypothetical protein
LPDSRFGFRRRCTGHNVNCFTLVWWATIECARRPRAPSTELRTLCRNSAGRQRLRSGKSALERAPQRARKRRSANRASPDPAT